MVDRRELSLGIIFTANVAQFNAAMTQLRAKMVNMAGAVDKTGKAATKTGKSTKKMGDEFTQVGKQLSKVEGGVQRLLAAFKVVAAYGIAGTLMFGIINSIREGIDSIFEFDQALFNLQAITNASEAEINAMGKAIFQVAEDTKFSAKEVGDAMVLLGQAGFTAAESMDAINAVAMLATGTLTDLKTSSDLLTTVIRAFGLEASDSARVADVMANAITRSKLTVDKLRIAFNYIGPVANKVGLTIEETAAATMVLANAGIRASTIGTGLRQVLARLKAPNEKLREAFIAAGADISKFTGDTVNMRDLMEELVKIVPNATRAFQLFGLRGAPAVSALTEAGVEGFDKMYESVLRAGEATRMAETQMQGLVVMAKNLADRMGTLAIRIGEGGIAGAFEVFIRVARELVRWLTILAENPIAQVAIGTAALSTLILIAAASFRFLTFAAGSLVAGLGAVLVASGHTVASMKAMIAMTNTATVTWAIFLNTLKAHPWFFIASGIGLVIAAFKILDRHQKRVLLNMETEERVASKNVATLEKYQKRLEELTPGTAEYGAELERLAQQFPELADSIDRTTQSLRDHGSALGALKLSEADKAVALLVGQWARYADQLRVLRLEAKRGGVIEFGPEFADMPIIDTGKKIGDVTYKLETAAKRAGEVFWAAGYRANTSWSVLVETLQKMVPEAGIENIEALASVILNALFDIDTELNKVKDSLEDVLHDLPDYWKEKFQELNAVEQVALIESLRTMDSRVAGLEKRASEMGLTEKHIAAATAAMRLGALKDFVEKAYGEVETSKFTRKELLRLEKDYIEQKRAYTAEEIENINATYLHEKNKAEASGKTQEDIAKAVLAAHDKKTEGVKAANDRLAGYEAGLSHIRQQRAKEDAKALSDAESKIALDRARLAEKMETDKVEKLKLGLDKRLAEIKKQEDEAIKLAEETGKKTVEIEKFYGSMRNKAREEFANKYNDLIAKRIEDQLKMEELLAAAEFEAEKRRGLESLDTAADIKRKELELEERFLRKQLDLVRESLSLRIGDTEKLKMEELELELQLQENLTDQTMAAHNRRIKGLERGSEAYIRRRQKVLRDAGEEELMIEREKWAIMAQYPEDWLDGLKAGFMLATIDFKLAARDWSTIVKNSAQHISGFMEEYFFQAMKGNMEGMQDAWKSFLDALLRELARFLADRATAEFLAMMLRFGSYIASAQTTGTTGTESGAFHGGAMYEAHRGGEVGVDVFPIRRLSKALIAAAPRLHSGLRPDEFPAVLQRGEIVTPRDEAGGGGDVNITIMTPDTRTMDQWVKRHSSLFAGATAAELRGGNKQLVSSVKKVSRG